MVFLALVMLKPRDFPYSKKFKKLTESLLPKRLDSMIFSPNKASPKETMVMNFSGYTT